MPVRSLRSSILKWPDATEVDAAVRTWAEREAAARTELVRLGYFGSYARGEAGVGSDLDLVAVVTDSAIPFSRRPIEWDLNALPVPAELLVYTRRELSRLLAAPGRFAEVLKRETVWVLERQISE